MCVGLFKAMKMHHGSTIENRNYVSVNEICICLHTCGKRKSYTRDALSMNNNWSIIFIFVLFIAEKNLFWKHKQITNGY